MTRFASISSTESQYSSSKSSPGKSKRDVYILSLAILVIAYFTAVIEITKDSYTSSVRLYLADVSSYESAEIFSNTGNGYNSHQRLPKQLKPNRDTEVYRFELPDLVGTSAIRIDLANKPTKFTIRKIRLSTIFGDRELTGADLLDAAEALHQTELRTTPSGDIVFISNGVDPQFQLLVPDNLKSGIRADFLVALVVILLVSTAAAVLVLKAASWFARNSKQITMLSPYALPVLVIGAALLGLAGQLHLSSLEMWNAYLPDANVEKSTLLGSPLAIRSDEWVTQSPWILSQWQAEKPLEAGSYPEGMLWLVAAPSFDITMLAQPKFWGSLLFDIERSFSWMWIYKSLGLLCAMFFLFFTLTRNRFYSVIGAFLIYGTSSTQWWFSSNLPEILLGFAVATTSLLKISTAGKLSHICLFAALFWISAASILMHPYPPFIVPLFYVGLIVTILIICQSDRHQLRQNLVYKMVGLSVAMLALVAFGLYLYINNQPAIELVSNTVYPGQRISTGGEVTTSRFFAAFFEFWRSTPESFPLEMVNASESSASIPFWLLFAPICIALWKQKPYLELVLVFFAICMTYYMLRGISEPLALWSLMSFVPGTRLVVALGIVSILVFVLLAARIESNPEQPPSRALTISAPLLTLIFLLSLGLHLQSLDDFYTLTRILASAFTLSILTYGLLRSSRELVSICTLLLITPSLSVNPISSGLEPLLDKPVFQTAREVSSTDSKWLVNGDGAYAQAFVANGFTVLFGQQYVPDLKVYEIIDPESANINVWNRYARINVLDSTTSTPEFELIQGDNFSINMDLCSPLIRKIGVTHIASQSNLTNKQCLIAESKTAINGLFLYRIKDFL